MGSVHQLKSLMDPVPHKRIGTFGYWPPEMDEGRLHDTSYDIYCLGLMLLEMRTAQLPFKHLQHLPWPEQRLRRTYDELVTCSSSGSGSSSGGGGGSSGSGRGDISALLPGELRLLQRCLQVDTMLRPTAEEVLLSGTVTVDQQLNDAE
jgi:serine/threonine protein kinase